MGDILKFSRPDCDEHDVNEIPVPQPLRQKTYLEPPSQPDDDQVFGQNATIIVKRPYVTVYYGSGDLERLTISQSKTYGYVRSWNDCGSSCNASLASIAKAVGVSRRQIRRIIRQLTCAGLLRRVPRPGNTSILEARRNV